MSPISTKNQYNNLPLILHFNNNTITIHNYNQAINFTTLNKHLPYNTDLLKFFERYYKNNIKIPLIIYLDPDKNHYTITRYDIDSHNQEINHIYRKNKLNINPINFLKLITLILILFLFITIFLLLEHILHTCTT